MKIYRDINNFHVENPVVTIGSFDGVHLGHHKILNRLNEIARDHNGESVVFTFYPHPRLVLYPEEHNLRLLTTLEEKIKLFEQIGIQHLIVFPFTKEFASLSYTDFVRQILVKKLNISKLVVGYDHKFGKNREGSFEMLQTLSTVYKFDLEKLDVLLMDDINISSTKIRKALQEGDVRQANKYLGYSFSLHGHVVEGQKLGRKIDYPTANIEASDPNKIIPGHGVYAVYVYVENKKYKGMLNIGTRPTINNNADQRSIEVHIIGFEGNIYKKEVEIDFIKKIRDEKKFASIDELKTQLALDKEEVSKML